MLAVLATILIALAIGNRIGTDWAIPGWASFLAASFAIIFLQALMMSGFALFQLMSFRNMRTFVPAVDVASLIKDVQSAAIVTAGASKSRP